MIENYAKEMRWQIEILKDISFRLKENRRSFVKLLKMVMNKKVSKVIIVYPDRLTRFGSLEVMELKSL